MSGAKGFSITISAADRATSVIDKINKSLQGVAAPASRLQGSLEELGNVSGITKLGKGLGGLMGKLSGLAKEVGKIGGATAALGSLATIGGIIALESSFAKLSLTLTNNSMLLGMAPAQLGRLTNALKLLNPNLTSQGIASGIQSMQDTAASAAFGQNGEAAGTLQRAAAASGVKNWRDLTTDPKAEYLAMGRYLASMKGPYAEVARLRAAASVSMPEDLIGPAMQGKKALDAAMAQAGKNSPTNQQISDGTRLAKTLEGASQAINGLTTTIADKLSPLTDKIAKDITGWADGANNFVKTKVGDKLDDIVKDLGEITKGMGAWSTATDILAAAMGVNFALKVLTPFRSLMGVTTAIGEALGAMTLKAIPAFISVLAGLAPVLLPLVAAGGALGALYYALHPASAPENNPDKGLPGGPETPWDVNNPALAKTAGDMTNAAKKAGLPNSAIGALYGNAAAESSLNPHNGGNATHHGLFQWSDDRLKAFKGAEGVDFKDSTAGQQTDFAIWELKNKFPALYKEMLDPKIGTDQKTKDFYNQFEAPGPADTTLNKRQLAGDTYANALDKLLGANSNGSDITSTAMAPPRAASKGYNGGKIDMTPHDERWRITHPDEASGLAGGGPGAVDGPGGRQVTPAIGPGAPPPSVVQVTIHNTHGPDGKIKSTVTASPGVTTTIRTAQPTTGTAAPGGTY